MNRLWIAAECPGRPPAQEATTRRLGRILRRWSPLIALPLILGACAGAPSGSPSGSPSCTAASISDVLAALENVSGYTFTASGTSLTVTPRSADGSVPYEYQSPKIALRGAYRAPDRDRLEVVAGGDAVPPVGDPGIFFLGVDSITVIGDRTWVGSQGSSIQSDPNEPGEWRSNRLLDLLRGAPEAGDVQWSSAGACSFRGQWQRDDVSMRTSVQVEVGPGALPHKIVEEWRLDLPDQPRREYQLTYLPDFDQEPDIVDPGP
jgi:hypothetical protein